MHRFMFLILCVVLLAACGSPETSASPTSAASIPTSVATSNTDDPCAADALKAYRLKYNSVIDRWGSAVLTAGQAKAADLQGPIDSLKQIADELGNLQPPPCAQEAHES